MLFFKNIILNITFSYRIQSCDRFVVVFKISSSHWLANVTVSWIYVFGAAVSSNEQILQHGQYHLLIA